MAFDTVAPASYLLGLLGQINSLAWYQLGAPESKAPRVGAYVTAGAQRFSIKTQGVMKREARYFVDFAYRLDGKESDAEMTLMQSIDAFLVLFFKDITLGSTVQESSIEAGLADEPDYRTRSGKEFREWPCVITTCQYATFEVTPNPA